MIPPLRSRVVCLVGPGGVEEIALVSARTVEALPGEGRVKLTPTPSGTGGSPSTSGISALRRWAEYPRATSGDSLGEGEGVLGRGEVESGGREDIEGRVGASGTGVARHWDVLRKSCVIAAVSGVEGGGREFVEARRRDGGSGERERRLRLEGLGRSQSSWREGRGQERSSRIVRELLSRELGPPPARLGFKRRTRRALESACRSLSQVGRVVTCMRNGGRKKKPARTAKFRSGG